VAHVTKKYAIMLMRKPSPGSPATTQRSRPEHGKAATSSIMAARLKYDSAVNTGRPRKTIRGTCSSRAHGPRFNQRSTERCGVKRTGIITASFRSSFRFAIALAP